MKFKDLYKEIERNTEMALLSMWTPGDHPMREAMTNLFKREKLLAKPAFQSQFKWESANDSTWRNYFNHEFIRKIIPDTFTPHSHQAKSWGLAHSDKSFVVTSGTSSGKTECFLYPVLNHAFLNKNTKSRLSQGGKNTNLLKLHKKRTHQAFLLGEFVVAQDGFEPSTCRV